MEKNQSHNNDIEHMINNFKESNQEYLDGTNGYSSNDAFQSMIANIDMVTISTYKVSLSNIKFREISDNNLLNRVSEERKERKLNNTDGLFIAVALILKPAFCFFMLCPEVVFLDVTLHTNNKEYHLLSSVLGAVFNHNASSSFVCHCSIFMSQLESFS
jgi:hypothetical protein